MSVSKSICPECGCKGTFEYSVAAQGYVCSNCGLLESCEAVEEGCLCE